MSREIPTSPVAPLSGHGLPPSTDVARDEGQVAAFPTLLEAEMALGRLEAAGIEVRLVDAGVVGVAAALANAIGGVKVCVDKDDVEEARAVLQAPASATDDEALAAEALKDGAHVWGAAAVEDATTPSAGRRARAALLVGGVAVGTTVAYLVGAFDVDDAKAPPACAGARDCTTR